MSKKSQDKEIAKDVIETAEQNEAASKELNSFEERISELEAELSAMTDKYQRVCAEYDNLQKRVPRQIQDGINYQKEAILKSMLSGMDNFAHTLASANETHDADSIIKGVRLVYKGFLDALKSHGVEQMESLGEQFDPSRHQAMMQQCDEDKPDNTVLVEYQKGYLLNDRVLRPAMVIVNKLESDSADDAAEE